MTGNADTAGHARTPRGSYHSRLVPRQSQPAFCQRVSALARDSSILDGLRPKSERDAVASKQVLGSRAAESPSRKLR